MRRIPLTRGIIVARMSEGKSKISLMDDRVALDDLFAALKRTEVGLSKALDRSQVIAICLHLERLDQQWHNIENLVVKQTESSVSLTYLPAALLSGVC